MGKFNPDVIRIASIYPGKMPRIQMNHGPTQFRTDGTSTVYELKPVPRGESYRPVQPCIIEIYDSFEHSKDEMRTALGGGTPVWTILPVSCEEIAEFLMTQWTGHLVDLPYGALPGIMKIRGTTPHKDELEQMKQQQQAYFEFWFLAGDEEAKKDPRRVSPVMKLAAEYLGREMSWSHASKSLSSIKCPACKRDIPEDSLTCGICGTRLKVLTPELARLNPELARLNERAMDEQSILSK